MSGRDPVAGCCIDIDGDYWHDPDECPNRVGEWAELWADIEHTRRTGEIHRPKAGAR